MHRSPLNTALLTGLLLLAACSSSDDTTASHTSSDAPTSTTEAPADGRPACDRPLAEPPEVEPVDGVPSDHRLVSFDDTEIRLHWFPAPDDPAPTVLSGPGWSLPGETSLEKSALFGSVGIGTLNDRGYNVLTWDPRGFGESTGTVSVDHPDFEGRDVSRIIDWLATQDSVQLDAEGDPRIGMIGASYGGGIQLAVAATDCRVDAIVPGLAWHSLETALYLHETVKTGWAGSLVGAAAGADLDPHIEAAHLAGLRTGRIGEAEADWFRDRGPADSVASITAPTLFVQGTVDTLFGLAESVTNLDAMSDVPTALVWFCGGHGTCLTSDGDTDFVETATLAWLDRFLLDQDVDLPPGFQTVDQDGTRWTADAFPDADSTVTGRGDGTLELEDGGGSGPLTAETTDLLGSLVASFTPARATNALEVPIEIDVDAMAIGTPVLRLGYTGRAGDGDRPTRVFAQLVDEADGTVVGNQVTPVPLELDGAHRELEVDLEMIAHRLRSGDRLTLQLTPTTVAYALPRLGGSIDFDRIEIDLPVVTNGLVEADG